MGQRARQRMAESLYGGKAKHILNPKLDANRRRREKLVGSEFYLSFVLFILILTEVT